MPTLPALTVLLDDGSGTFSFDVSSKVLAVDGFEISCGRDDWQSAVTAGELTLTLNNSDGRFTPGSTILGTPSPIKVDQQIRVQSSSLGFGSGGFGAGGFGGFLNRFTGYVKAWPVSWPATVSTFATVTLTATDAQARAERRTLRALVEEEILRYSPAVYYALSEVAGTASAGDTSGNQGPALQVVSSGGAALAFESDVLGSTADGTTGVAFPGTPNAQFLATNDLVGPGAQAIGVQFVTSTVPPSGAPPIWSYGGGGHFSLDSSSGRLDGGWSGAPGLISPASVADGVPHMAILVADPASSTFSMILDGVVVASVPATFIAGAPSISQVAAASAAGNTFTGTVAKAVAWPTLTVAQAQAITALAAGVAESSTARLTRLAAYAGIAVGTLDPSLTMVPAQATAGTADMQAMQDVVDAELGLVYIDGSGRLAFHNRARAAGKNVPDLILDAQYVTPDVQPVTDDQQIVNYFEATAATGTGATQLARDQASEITHGRYPTTQAYLVQTDREALDRANWIVGKQAEPGTRYGTLTINLYKMTAAQAATVIAALDLDCWLRVTSMASQNPGGTVADVMVQGWREASTGKSWAISCNVVPRSLYTALILDDPTFGALDSYPAMF